MPGQFDRAQRDKELQAILDATKEITIGWKYWMRKYADGTYKLFVGSTLLVKSKDIKEVNDYLIEQLVHYTTKTA